MTVVVTGAGGFVGRSIVKALLGSGLDVSGCDISGDSIPSGARSVAGDLSDRNVRAALLEDGCDTLIHLATVPGGAAEGDPAASRRINIDAMYDLLLEAQRVSTKPRVIYASSIAALGKQLPASGVTDDMPVSPEMIYGGHKAMMEIAVCMMHNRGEIDGFSLRLPGILARPMGPSGMKSAFMSDVYHSIVHGREYACPVSSAATIAVESLEQVTKNFMHAMTVDTQHMPSTRVVTLPALRVGFGEMVEEIAKQCGQSSSLVSYEPDTALEAAFGVNPPFFTDHADKAGFSHDGTIAGLVKNALSTLLEDT